MAPTTPTVWRFDFRTDLTNAKSHVIPLAYLVSFSCVDDGRFAGMLRRNKLTPAELARVNLDTWPELKHLNAYLGPLAKEAADQGFEALERRFPAYSALQMAQVKAPAAFVRAIASLCRADVGNSFEKIVRKHFEKKLEPTFPQALGKHRNTTTGTGTSGWRGSGTTFDAPQDGHVHA